MPILQDRLDEARDLSLANLKSKVTDIEVGDDGTAASPSDTGVISSIGSAPYTSRDESVAGQITWNTQFGISEFVGDTVREVSLKDSTDSSSRDNTVEATKGGDQIFWFSITAKCRAINNSF